MLIAVTVLHNCGKCYILIQYSLERGSNFMTTKQRLLQELETTSETLMEEVLDFLLFIKSRHAKSEITNTESTVSISYRPASGESLLRHAGGWSGDDLADSLESVYESRSTINISKTNLLRP
ncbi:hypothetical protein cce_3850 [Crocosphaera subtropica ATCC 51142]|uniref:DUF2281 domain-containing protein n=2 Tax=Crocosphaera TaxID=263510 RepID=B1WP19_CROS5|nr:hypothetical protein cce_3850 [Crocosphaera subtropica ATCC 51142]